MTIYHARLNVASIRAVRQQPAQLWQLGTLQTFDHAELLSAGDGAEWLLRWPAVDAVAEPRPITRPPGAIAADQGDAGAGLQHGGLPPPLLMALDGRHADEPADAAIDYGRGAARIFSPVVVRELAAGLRDLSPRELRGMLDAAQPAAAGGGVAPIYVALTAFETLQHFYIRAAAYGQYVLVVGA